MKAESGWQRNRLFCYKSELVNIITCVFWFSAVLGKLHSRPFVSHTAAAFIFGISCIFDAWLQSKTSLIFLLKMLVNLICQGLNFLVGR